VDENNGTVTWDPTQTDVGTTDFKIGLRDDEGGETILTLRITVSEVDDPPVAGPVDDIEVMVGERKQIVLSVTDEEGRLLEYGSNTSLVWIDNEGVMFINGSSEHIGINTVRIFISDGLNTVYVTFNVTVKGEGEDSGSSGKDDRFQYVLGGMGLAIAVIALLFLGFTFLRRTEANEDVISELEDADELYEEDMDALEAEYASGSEMFEE
jgi:hypothetical protein